jgi:L-threonylcarbamoyladenylate synthase
MIEVIAGPASLENKQLDIRTSGDFKKHYSPRARVLIDTDADSGQGLIALEFVPTPRGVIRILSPKDAKEFAYLLYSGLRKVDELGLTECVVVLPEGSGLEAAIRDRVIKAQGLM